MEDLHCKVIEYGSWQTITNYKVCLRCWVLGGGADNSPPNVLYMGVSYSSYRAQATLNSTQSLRCLLASGCSWNARSHEVYVLMHMLTQHSDQTNTHWIIYQNTILLLKYLLQFHNTIALEPVNKELAQLSPTSLIIYDNINIYNNIYIT